jgi:hypothetical protein
MKSTIKHLVSLITLIGFIFIAYGSKDTGALQVQAASNLEEVKEEIELAFDDLEDEYFSLCKEKRNDYLKTQFIVINGEMVMIMHNSIEKNTSLSYQEQKEASEYAKNKIKEYPELYEYDQTGKIPCW